MFFTVDMELRYQRIRDEYFRIGSRHLSLNRAANFGEEVDYDVLVLIHKIDELEERLAALENRCGE